MIHIKASNELYKLHTAALKLSKIKIFSFPSHKHFMVDTEMQMLAESFKNFSSQVQQGLFFMHDLLLNVLH